MYQITKELATHGIGEKGTHPLPWDERDIGFIDGWQIYDVRFLSDLGEDNPLALYALTIKDVCHQLATHKTVICCGAGQSRSNAIAVGALTYACMWNYWEALALVKSEVPICNIDPSHLAALKKLFRVTIP